MKKWLSLFLLFWCASSKAAPALVQWVNGPGVNNATATKYILQFGTASLSGNLLVCFFNTGTGNTGGAVADNIGNTWTRRVNVTGNQRVAEFDSQGATLGVLKITYTPSTGVTNIQGACGEFSGVATSSALDVTCNTTSGSGTSVACGSMTTTVDGDLILQYGVQDSGIGMTSWTHGTSPFDWVSMGTDIQIGQATQWQVQAAHGAITPAMTQAPTHNFDTVGISFKAAAAGTAPTGMHIVGVGHANILGSKATGFKVPAACTGNLLVIGALMIDAVTITSISDGTTNATAAAAQLSNTGSGQVRFWYYPNYACSTAKVLTINFSGSNSSGDTIITYDVAGANASPLDAAITCGTSTLVGSSCQNTGTDSGTGSHTINAVTVLPSTTGGILFSMMGVTDPQPINAVTPGNFTGCVSTPEASSADMDENNGYALEYNSSTSSRTYAYTAPISTAGNWAAVAVAFLAPSGGGGNLPQVSVIRP